MHGGKPLLFHGQVTEIEFSLTTSNIIFRFPEEVDDAIYRRLGSPQIEKVSGSPLRPHSPANLVEPIINSKLTEASFLKETVVVIGFGQSYAV